jgi:drug/metabolite transporter (DMT)-like permease
MRNHISEKLLGMAALMATVVLWSSFALSARAIHDSSLTTIDVAMIRFLTPLVLLAPWLPRTLKAVRHEWPGAVAAIAVGGLPHFLLFALGADLTTAGLTGLLVPGSVPLFVTVIVFLFRRTPIPNCRLVALAAIIGGVAASAMQATSSATKTGIAVLLLAGLAWAIYTIGLQYTRLDLPGVVLIVCTVSSLSTLALALSRVMPSHLLTGAARGTDVLLFTALQGVGTGLLSTVCYAYAVRTLGGHVAAASGAMSPVLTALAAVPLFAEPITAGLAIALILIVTGVTAFHLTQRVSHRRQRAHA